MSTLTGERDVVDRLRDAGWVAIVRTSTLDLAREAARAAQQGGARAIEITFGVPGCTALVTELAAAWPDVLVGVGTVMSVDEVWAAAEAGARFSVSPNTDATVVAAARQAGLAAIPGAATPTEVVTAWRAGASCVKVFPVKTLGGPEYIKLLRGPLPDVPLFATGGMELDRAAEYFAAGVVAVGVTGDLFQPDLLARRAFDEIAERARRWTETVAAVRAARQRLR